MGPGAYPVVCSKSTVNHRLPSDALATPTPTWSNRRCRMFARWPELAIHSCCAWLADQAPPTKVLDELEKAIGEISDEGAKGQRDKGEDG